MEFWWDNKLFPYLNSINGKTSPYYRNGVLRHFHYRSDPKLGPGIVYLRIITCSCHYCITQLYLTWGSKIKSACNQPRYGVVYDCKYSQILGYHNNWIIIIFIDYGTDEVDYSHIIRTILDVNVKKCNFLFMWRLVNFFQFYNFCW